MFLNNVKELLKYRELAVEVSEFPLPPVRVEINTCKDFPFEFGYFRKLVGVDQHRKTVAPIDRKDLTIIVQIGKSPYSIGVIAYRV